MDDSIAMRIAAALLGAMQSLGEGDEFIRGACTGLSVALALTEDDPCDDVAHLAERGLAVLEELAAAEVAESLACEAEDWLRGRS